MKLPFPALLLALPTPAQQSVIVVDDTPGPGVDFTQLQDAIDAAQADDVILVRAGIYGQPLSFGFPVPFVVSNPVSIVAEEGAVVSLTSPLKVVVIGAGESVVLRGLDLDFHTPGSFGEYACALEVVNCQGVVWAEDCRFVGPVGFLSFDLNDHPHTVRIEAADVVLRSCWITGGGAIGATFELPRALYAQSARVQLHDCFVAWDGLPLTSFGHGVGTELRDSFLFASGGEMHGGVGLNGGFFMTPFGPIRACGTDGGPAVVLGPGATGSEVFVLDCLVQGGAPGADPYACGATYGPAIEGDNGTATFLPGTARALAGPATATAGGSFGLSLLGEPGDLVVLGASPAPASGFVAALSGSLLLAQPFFTLVAGTTDATGALGLTFTAPAPQVGTEALSLYAQAVFVGAGGIVASSGTALTFLAPGL